MEKVVFLLIYNLLPVIFYFIAFLIPNKKLLATYTLFWLIIFILSFPSTNQCFDKSMSESSNYLDQIKSIAWTLSFPFSFGFPSFGTAMVGIIGKAFILYKENMNHEVELTTVQMNGLVFIILFNPLFYLGYTYLMNFIMNNVCHA
ncbi:MAG: hypothetical protein ACRC80_01740 [Waterburya sp.]